MEQGIMGTLAILTGMGVIGAMGFTFSAMNKGKRKMFLEELGALRDELYQLGKINERARIELETSTGKLISKDRDLMLEVQRLQIVVRDINELQRKVSLDELALLREELHELSLNNDKARKELQDSHTRRVSTEVSAKKEAERLRLVIKGIREFNKKQLNDELSLLRDRLCILSSGSELARIELENSYSKKIVTEEDIRKEIITLKSAVKDIEDSNRKSLLEKLTKVRNELYSLSVSNEKATEELESSYSIRLVTDKCISNEIDRLRLIIIEAEAINRKSVLDELNSVREDLYSKSRENEYARYSLEESYNRKITDQIAPKEIERLLEVKDRIKRDEMLKSYDNKLKHL